MRTRSPPGADTDNARKASTGQSGPLQPNSPQLRSAASLGSLRVESSNPTLSVPSPPRSILIMPSPSSNFKSGAPTTQAPPTPRSLRFEVQPKAKEHWIIQVKGSLSKVVEIRTPRGELVIDNVLQHPNELRRRAHQAGFIDFALPASFNLLPGIAEAPLFPLAQYVRSTHGLVPGCRSTTSVIFPLDGLIHRWENKSNADIVVFSTSTLRWPLRNTTFAVGKVPRQLIFILPVSESEKRRGSLTRDVKTHKYTKWVDGLRRVGKPEESLAHPDQFMAIAKSLMPLLLCSGAEMKVYFVGSDFLTEATHGAIRYKGHAPLSERIRSAFANEYARKTGQSSGNNEMMKRILIGTRSDYVRMRGISLQTLELYTQPSEALCHPHAPFSRRLLT